MFESFHPFGQDQRLFLRLNGDRLDPGVLFDRGQIISAEFANKRNGFPFLSRPPGPPDPVHIILRLFRHVIVDDV